MWPKVWSSAFISSSSTSNSSVPPVSQLQQQKPASLQQPILGSSPLVLESIPLVNEFSDPDIDIYRLKCSIVGDYNVGKTTLVHLLTDRYKPGQFGSTIGVEFFRLSVKMPNFQNAPIRLHMWDTAGTERYASIIKSYLRDNAFVLVAFDLNNRESWEHVDKWRNMILDLCDSREFKPFFALVGCKAKGTCCPLEPLAPEPLALEPLALEPLANPETSDKDQKDSKKGYAVTDEEIAAKALEWQLADSNLAVDSTEGFNAVAEGFKGTSGPLTFKISCIGENAKQDAIALFTAMTEQFHRYYMATGGHGISHACCSLVPSREALGSPNNEIIRLDDDINQKQRNNRCC